jgi:4-amino-4-deoxy-L-arabinose transferase-like glycosyltransferase
VEYLLSALVFLSGNLLSLAVLAATFYVVGRRLTVAFEYPDVWQEIAFSATLGFGVTASLVFVLGLANQLTRPVVLLTIAALHLISHGVWHDTIRRARSAVASSDWRKSVPHFIFVLVLIAPMLLLALYPPTQFDATLYHLPYAVAFADSGGLPFLETLRFPVFPQLQETLFVLGFFLTGEVAAQLCEFVALMLSGIVMVAWGRSLVNHRVGIWSAALWLGNPLAVWLGGAAYVDIGLTLFVTASLFAWHRWLRGAHNRWLVLSAALIGFACASKYLGLFFFAVLAIATLFVSVRRRDVRPALVVPSVVMAIAGPWYARIVYYTGNPVFPFYPNLFGPSIWSQGVAVSSTTPGESLPAFILQKILETTAHLDFLILAPFNAVFAREVFHRQAPISPWYLILTPVLIFFVLRLRAGRWIILLSLAYGLFWLTTVRDIRFLLPVLPVVSLALVLGADSVAGRYWPYSKRRSGLELVAVCMLVAPAWFYSCYKAVQLGPPPTTAQARSDFLSRHVGGFEAIEMLNETAGSTYTVYGLFAENLRYFAHGRFLGDHFGPNRFTQINRLLNHPRRLHGTLGLLKVDYLLIVKKGQPITLTEKSFFKRYFRVFANSPEYVLIERLDGGEGF